MSASARSSPTTQPLTLASYLRRSLLRFQLEAPKLSNLVIPGTGAEARYHLQIIGQYVFAPAQWEGRHSQKSDVWSFGSCILDRQVARRTLVDTPPVSQLIGPFRKGRG